MRRVVVTGLGIVSSIGNNANEVLASLKEAKSGVIAAPEYAELGFRCQVHAAPEIEWEPLVDRRAARFLAPGTAYAHIAMEQAIADGADLLVIGRPITGADDVAAAAAAIAASLAG